MSVTSGRMSPTPFAYYDRDSFCWRTSQGTFPWDSTPSSPTLPRWGSMRSGVLFERPTPELLTSGSGCSSPRGLLATPTAWLGRRPAHAVGDPARWTDPQRSNELSDQVAHLFPTPRATDGAKGGPGQRNGRGVADSLPAIGVLLPTPTANIDKGPGHSGRNGGVNLQTAITLLPTPTSRDHKDGAVADGRESDENAMLGRVAWRIEQNWGEYELAVRRHEATVTHRPPPLPTEPTGRNGGHRLSPPFVEWLMGLPEGWVTDPALGVPHSPQLTALGNGIVPQQMALALRLLTEAMP